MNLYGWAMSQSLHYDEIKFDKTFELEDILNTEDDSDLGYSFEVDLKFSGEMKEEIHFPFCPENKVRPQDKFSDVMNEMISQTCTPRKKLFSDWPD